MTERAAAARSPIDHIVLAGFMGSGKTTVGRLLAEELGWSFADLDEAIEQRTGLAVPEIFARQGEPAFRAAEVDALRSLLQAPGIVIALGGGAPETEAVRELLTTQPGTAVVHLHAPFEVLYERCLVQAQDPSATARPLLGARQAAAERYERRLPVYQALARYVADADTTSARAVADSILMQIRAQVTRA